MRIFVTVVERLHENRPEYEGSLYVVEWPVGDVYRIRVPVETTGAESRSFGLRGAVWHSNALHVGCADEKVRAINPDTGEVLSTLAPQGMKHIHALAENGGYVYGVSTATGALHRVCPGEPTVTSRLADRSADLERFVAPSHRDLSWSQDKLHWNTVAWHPETGDEIHCYATPGVIYNWTQRRVLAEGLVMPHDLVFVDHRTLAVCSSGELALCRIDASGTAHRVFRSGKPLADAGIMQPGWLRGAAQAGRRLFVAAAPGTLHEFDLSQPGWPLVRSRDFSAAIDRDAPYAVVVDPRGW